MSAHHLPRIWSRVVHAAYLSRQRKKRAFSPKISCGLFAIAKFWSNYVAETSSSRYTTKRAYSHQCDLRKTRLADPGRKGYKIWIDLENSPHVPFFLPIIREMETRGYKVVLTARDCFQTCELADLAGLQYRKIGHHYGKNPIAKLSGLAIRVLQLASLILRERPQISVSHCSRSSIILSAFLGIPSINIIDYEFADQRFTSLFGSRRKKWVLTPAIVPSEGFERCGTLADHILHYPGIKEDVYVPFFQPDPAWTKALGITSD